MPQFILQDLNVRDPFVSDSTDFLLYDTKVVVQSIWRLITTEEGEIPNYRVYGLSIKKFCQYPMSQETVQIIYNYVKNRVKAFEERGTIIRADVDANFNKQEVYYRFYVQVNTTSDIVKLPTWTVKLGSS